MGWRPLLKAAGKVGRSAVWGVSLVAAAVAGAMVLDVLRPAEDAFADFRFSLLRRPVSQALTVVEIDARSVRAAGQWPWPRDRFATAVANLEAAGARTVAFDVDFSVRSTAEADAKLAAAIAAKPGVVILPSFVQDVGHSKADSNLVETHPLAGLAHNALIASVNVPTTATTRAPSRICPSRRAGGLPGPPRRAARHSLAARFNCKTRRATHASDSRIDSTVTREISKLTARLV